MTNDDIRSEKTLLSVAALLYFLFLVYFIFGLNFNMLATPDIRGYLSESLKWTTPFSALWVPGYPLIIAAVRGLTLNAVPPIGIMAGISAVAYLIAVSAAYRLAIHKQFHYPFFLGLIFAISPFVGLTYAVYPNSDITTMALLLLAVLSLEKRQWVWFVVFSGACMMVHKVMWFFVPPLVLVAFVTNKESRRLLPCAFLPLLVWVVSGAIYHHDVIWFMRWGYEQLFVSRTSLPILDGLITPLLSKSPFKIGKGIVVGIVLALTVISALYSFRHKHWTGMCIALSLCAVIASVNSYEIWVVVRFSKLLIIPLAFVDTGFVKSQSKMRVRVAALLILGISLASNVAFGFYMSRF